MSAAFEKKSRIPLFREGEPILGMERWIDADLRKTFESLGAELVLAPNNAPADSQSASGAMHHGDFDDDEKTVFELLQTASGVGPRLAQAMLAVHGPDELRRAIAEVARHPLACPWSEPLGQTEDRAHALGEQHARRGRGARDRPQAG